MIRPTAQPLRTLAVVESCSTRKITPAVTKPKSSRTPTRKVFFVVRK